MFEHSIRVPRHYKVAANIFKKVSTEGGSIKTLLYDNKLRHFRTNVLFALITETVKHAADIDKIFEASEIFKNETRLDPWLAKVLATELLFGKKSLPGISKPEKTILAYKEQFEKYTNEHQAELKTEAVLRPRYIRVNTNLLTTSDAIRSFQDEGYRFIRCTSGSYNDYLQQIKSLTEYDFTQDYHVKTMFVFVNGTKFHDHELYLENQIILQDKATAMAVHLLAPTPGSVVLDMCAAPGMKTTQVAASMRNEGKVIAVERNEKRFQILTDFVNKTGSKCVELIHKDVLEIKKGDHDDVEYILLDPSCSGSGMEFTVHNYIEDTRLAKLTSLQEKFLKHAMNAFPKAKRIIYSTCSLFPEENERVITNVVKNSRAKWRVQDVKEMLKGQWNNFGSGMYGSMGTRCLYARPDSDLTTGFFLAVLDRDPADLEKPISGESDIVPSVITPDKQTNNTSNKRKRKKAEYSENNVSQIEDEGGNFYMKKKKKKERDILKDDLEMNTDFKTNNHESDDINKKSYNTKQVEYSAEPDESSNNRIELLETHKHIESECSNISNDNIVQHKELVAVEKKTKKQKIKDNPENQNINSEMNEDMIVTNKSKKKKKHKYHEHDNLNFEHLEMNKNVIVNNKSKKKKKHKYREHDNSDLQHLEEKKNISIVDETNLIDDNTNIEHAIKKKKNAINNNLRKVCQL